MMSQTAATLAFRRFVQKSSRFQAYRTLYNSRQNGFFSNIVPLASFNDTHNREGGRERFSKCGISQRRCLSQHAEEEEFDFFPVDEEKEEEEDTLAEELEERKRAVIRKELDSRKGRLWADRWELSDDDWSSGRVLEDLPDWTEEICSRISLERVQVHPDGVPTLEAMATLSLPTSAPPHPALGHPKPYVQHRKRLIFKHISDAVKQFAEPKMEKILSMENWNQKQDEIDILFELVHDAVKGTKLSGKDDDDLLNVVIGSTPNFSTLVERALENYLRDVVKDEKISLNKKEGEVSEGDSENSTVSGDDVVPIFMEFKKTKDSTFDEDGVPKLLFPLKPHPKHGPGRMIEEWELCSNESTRRIMSRQCTSEIANALTSADGSRVCVTGRKGAGKTTTLLSIVASARLSGHIVLFLPDGDRLRKNGFYIEPNKHRMTSSGEKHFDLPMLSKEVCGQLMESHSEDLKGMNVTEECLQKYMTEKDIAKVLKHIQEGESDGDENSFAVTDLLKIGSDNVDRSAGCYNAVIDTLMNQDEKPFTVVMDQFNCYFDYGHYFHMDYDENVKNAIPPQMINLFQPFIDAMGVEKMDDESVNIKESAPMKRGGIVVGITQSHAVKQKFTTSLTDAMNEAGVKIVNVPHYSPLEVEHILANFEISGIGRLRFDRGETVMNQQEVAYLRMVSGGYGQPLLDACLH